MSLISPATLNTDGWCGPYKLFYYAPSDPRPFVPKRRKNIFSDLTRNGLTVNFANLEGNVWLVSLLAISIYPWLRNKYLKKQQSEETEKRNELCRLNKDNWYGPFNHFYYCADDSRPFVENNVDVFPQTRSSALCSILFQKKITLNFASNEARCWLCLIFGLALFPVVRMKNEN